MRQRPATQVSVAHAKATFSALLEGVLHRGERYVIERDGREVAALVSPSEFRRLIQEMPLADRPAGAMALVSLWHDVPDDDIDAMLARLRGRVIVTGPAMWDWASEVAPLYRDAERAHQARATHCFFGD